MDRMTVRDAAVKGKTVIVRVDFNVPVDSQGNIVHEEQIKLHFPTLEYLDKQGAKIVLITHFGNPGFAVKENLRLDKLAECLEKLWKKKVRKVDQVTGQAVQQAIATSKPGEIVLLENIRFYPEERDNEETFAAQLAALGDVFVNDSFGTCHRTHASTVGIAKKLPAVAGLLLEKELTTLEKLLKEPEKPFTLILGGNKGDVKVNVVQNFLERADNFLIGGGLANTFLRAQGFEVGRSYFENELTEKVQEMMLTIEANHAKVITPEDVRVADEIGDQVPVIDIPVEDVEYGMKIFDIGQRTTEKFLAVIEQSQTIVWNGPLGACEHTPFRKGTLAIAGALAKSKKTTIVGGGETLECLVTLGIPFSSFTHVSTGGGAMLEFLQGHSLPAVKVLRKKQ